MPILRGIKQIFALVGLTADQTVQEIAGIRVHRVVARSIVVIVVGSWFIAGIFVLMQMPVKNIDTVLRPLNFAFASGCDLMSYLCLCRKTKQVDDCLDYMENVVENRKY